MHWARQGELGGFGRTSGERTMRAGTRSRSRLLSPTGFTLVLLLFLALPFLSVSCEVSELGSIGADFHGAHLVAGTQPKVEVPPGLEDMARDLPGSGVSGQPLPDPGVHLLAIILTVVLVAGVVLPFVPRLARTVRRQMFGGAALAVVAAALMIVMQELARSNLTGQLAEDAKTLGDDVPDADEIADQLIHTEVGFWLSVVMLAAIVLGSVGYVYRDKIFARSPAPAKARPSAGSTAPPIWQAAPADEAAGEAAAEATVEPGAEDEPRA
jgi:hypothetical protein